MNSNPIEQVWDNLRVGDRFKTPDDQKGVYFSISRISSDMISIRPQGIAITRSAFEAALNYLWENNCHAGNKCEIMSKNDRREAGPLCQASRDENNNVRCINYIVPILKANGIVDFSGDRPNKVWFVG